MIISKKRTSEETIVNVKFDIHKFSTKPKPDEKKTIIISCFSEFGCEIIGVLYCLPRIIAENPDAYIIAMGWHGRQYLYKHLVDEFWEIKEEFQWLRDYSLAFHHNSRNLKRIEQVAKKYGKVTNSEALGRLAVGNTCNSCKNFWGQTENVKACPKCKSDNIVKSLFSDVRYWRQRMKPVPPPSDEKMEQARKLLGDNPVGVFARNRKTYGRNLQPDFYVKLAKLLQSKDYTPIWLGERQTSLACPIPGITDMTQMAESRDLELTLAIVSQVVFTTQFWTASTRLASLTGTPYLIFESPDQLFGAGQEAYRLALCTSGHNKIVLCHYLKVYNDNDSAIELVGKCVEDMENGDFCDVIGMVDEPEVVYHMRASNLHRLGGL